MTFWREASTLILALRPCVSGSATKPASALSRTTDYKILMLKRSARSSFMPSKLVFPGGMVHDTDHSTEWNGVFEKVMGFPLTGSSCQPTSTTLRFPRSSPSNWNLPPNVAYRICAIRETFEESGLLLATNRDLLRPATEPSIVSSSSRDLMMAAEDYRQKVEQNPEHFVQMCKDLGVVPNLWALSEWRNWLTPVFSKLTEPPKKPKRFNTMFYVSCVDSDALPHTSADEGETTTAEWKTAAAFLEDDMNRDEGRPPLAPPQVYEMHNLRTIKSLDDLLAECKKHHETGVECWMPVYRICRDAVMLFLPGDYLYPTEPDYEGTKDLLPPLHSSTSADLTDSSRSLNRIVFTSRETLRHLSQVDTTVKDTALVDNLLQKGTVVCNL